MPDSVITVYNQIITLLKAEATLYDATASNRALIWPKNFVDFAGTNPVPQKVGMLAENKRDGDYPELMVDDGQYADTAFTYMQTFSTQGPQQLPQAWREKFTQVYTITLTTRDWQLAPATALRAAVAVALRKGGPRLNLPLVVASWGPLSAVSARSESAGTGNSPRRVIKILVPVVFNFEGSTSLI